VGAARVRRPATTDTGVVPRSYDDRGAYEYQPPVAIPALVPRGDGRRRASAAVVDAGLLGQPAISQFSIWRGTRSGGETCSPRWTEAFRAYTDTGVTNESTYFYY